MKQFEKEELLGFFVENVNQSLLIDDIVSWVREGKQCRWLACINPHSYALAKNNSEFTGALHKADWLIPDGTGIVLASRVLGGKISERITGSDIFKGVHDCLNHMGGTVFLLGATEATLNKLSFRLQEKYPGISVSGSYSPPFKSAFSAKETDEMIDAINSVSPDVLWVGMTSPKQDVWLASNHMRLNVKFAAGVGAVFDFYSGNVERSHPIFQKLGLEWLPRLLQEPRRLWRRMLISAPIFLFDTFLARIKKSNARRTVVR